MKSVTTLLALALCVAVQAGVDVEIVDKPKYWSHTNNRIVCHAEITEGTQGITAYRVLIDGEVVKSKTYMAGPIYRVFINPKIMFDSTQWSHLTNLEVRFEVKTTDSTTYWNVDSHDDLVKNKVGMFKQDGIAAGGTSRLSAGYANMNYDIFAASENWTQDDLMDGLSYLSALDYYGHGTYLNHYDADGTEEVYAYEYWDPLSDKIGTGLPPFNSTQWPPLNFVHFYSCHLGGNASWNALLYPFENVYEVGEDQALLAYTVFVWTTWHDELADSLMDTLEGGDTVATAKIIIVDREDVRVEDPASNFRWIEPGDIAIMGDGTTRLTQVYTGSSISPIGWYRVLQED